eukprot:m.520780 g.520780  ORF g.520780 m.520780 type:complete len:52 (+) comp21954_c0_seq10:1493-1648(+)
MNSAYQRYVTCDCDFSNQVSNATSMEFSDCVSQDLTEMMLPLKVDACLRMS